MFLVAAIVVPAVLPFENIFSFYLGPWGLVALLPGDMVVGRLIYRNDFWLVLACIVVLLFWGCIGYFYARWTLRIRTFFFVLLAYPVMWAALWVFLAPIYFLFENLLGIHLGTM